MRLRLRALSEALEHLTAMDAPAGKVQGAFRRVVPDDSPLKDILSGTWLGHSVHPLLTDVVVGAWTSAWLLDLVPSDRTRAAADHLIGIGCLAALPTAITGLSDASDLAGRSRRTAAVHATGNTTALMLYSLAWLQRRRGRRASGWLLSQAGYAVANFSAFVGGHLSFGMGVGVNQTAFEPIPGPWTVVLDEDELPPAKPIRAYANGVAVMLYRDPSGVLFALADRCSHRGCSLAGGEVEDGAVTCPCHTSTFRLADGSVKSGPAHSPQPALDVRLRDAKVEVRARPSA